jgi:MFS family permease
MMSLYLVQIADSIGSTVGRVALALSIATIGAIFGAALIGRVMKVLDHRIMIVIAAICVFMFQFTISRAASITPIYIAAFFNGFGTTWGGMAMSQIIITQWFEKARGTVMSLFMIAMSLVLAIAFPLVAGIISAIGYRPVVFAVGLIGSVGMIICGFLTSGEPKKYGLKAYGTVDIATGEERAGALPPSLSFKSILKSPAFWMICLIVGLATVAAQGFSSQMAVIFGSFGLNEINAAFVVSIFSLVGVFWTFFFGFLCDKLGPKNTMTIFGSLFAAVLLFAFLWQGFAGAVIFAVFFAAGNGLSGLYGPNMAPRLFGVQSVGDMMGFLSIWSGIGASVGPAIFGLMYDSMGNYTAALVAMGFIAVTCILLNFLINSKKVLAKIQEQITRESTEQNHIAQETVRQI